MNHAFSIEQIHEMLDGVERSLTRLRSANLHSKVMPTSFISDGVSVIYDLDLEDMLGSAGISRTLANKLKNLDGSLPANVMLAALERVRSYLRRIESEHKNEDGGTDEDQRIVELDRVVERNPPNPIPVWAETWTYIRPGSRAKVIISELSDLLDEILLFAKSTNLPEDQAALTDMERAQLIALLETALLMLKGPMVERGLLKKLSNAAEEAAIKAARKSVEQGMAEAISVAAPRIWELIKSLIS